MAIGSVFMSTAPAIEHDLYDKISMMKVIVEVHPLLGEYDLMVKVEAKDYNRQGQIVVDRIRPVLGIIRSSAILPPEGGVMACGTTPS